MIVGITGKARSGKDTAAQFFINSLGYEPYSFADPLKRACSEMFGVPLDHFYDDNLKDKLNTFWGFSPRRMAQLLGTEGGRKLFRDDIWIKRAQLVCDRQQKNIVIPDVRFENEADFVRSKGGIMIHIERESPVSVESHESENGIKVKPRDFVVYNNLTIDSLHSALATVMTVIDHETK